jgi:hypothetical protein
MGIKTYYGNQARAVRFGASSWLIYSADGRDMSLDGAEGQLMERNINTGLGLYLNESPEFGSYVDRLIATYF